MDRVLGKRLRAGAVSLLAAAVLAVLGACDGGILDVDRGGIVVPDDIDAAGPAAVPTLINGFVGDYHEAIDDVVRYAGLLTDEFILGGTFPTRVQVDSRRILVNNLTLTVEQYVPLHRARLAADTAAFILEGKLGDPDFAEVEDDMRRGIALAAFYGGYARLWLAELYCWSILTGMAEESTPLMPNERMQQALQFLQNAETLAEQEGLADYVTASIVGQARAHLWLGNYDQAAALASGVDTDFLLWSEFSDNDPDQYNEVYTFSWGDTQVIRWTVGDGSQASRGNERFEFFDQFVDMNLITPNPPGLRTFQGTIPVMLQMQYPQPRTNIYIASGVEARLIEAEVAVRNGETGTAEDILNDLRAGYHARASARFDVDEPAEENQLQDLALSGDMETDIKTVADERARELWLTGDRHTTSRRLRLDPTVDIDLFPPVKGAIGGGDDIAFPIVQREIDNNPNLSEGDACPSGGPGSWGL